jgi:Leucine-rich repeat (LRR) protein
MSYVFIIFIYTKAASTRSLRDRASRRTSKSSCLSVVDGEDDLPFHYLPHIRVLGLEHLNLTKIPGVLRYTNKLAVLDISNNWTSAVIPSWIWVNWKDTMVYLDLSNNMFRGLKSCPKFKLQTLNLNSNKLHRVVPITLTPTSLVGSTLDY